MAMKVKIREMGHRSLIDMSALESGIVLKALEEYEDNPNNSERDKKTINRMIKQIKGDPQ